MCRRNAAQKASDKHRRDYGRTQGQPSTASLSCCRIRGSVVGAKGRRRSVDEDAAELAVRAVAERLARGPAALARTAAEAAALSAVRHRQRHCSTTVIIS